ncbi:type IV secretion system protein VirB10 [Malonomonas rubra DSM 5091]|uniref:Type IV secretion system protein VirB10 n=1 Tax=Malonomonas rubra DSM 5091 TaxID=1122189 RepID=A0A1M6KT58_MALRU|nr:type IV secretion system protein VirB10 [Malonomonas rubra]SHJ62072.1 type IV secretion system protein VirB10 [Malonomonas rubra DSM 5091]
MDENNQNQLPDNHEVEGERGLPPVNSAKRNSALSRIGMVFIGVLALVAILAVNGVFSEEEKTARPGDPATEERRKKIVASNLPELIEPEKKVGVPAAEPKPEPVRPKVINTGLIAPAKPVKPVYKIQKKKKVLTPEERRMLPGVFADQSGGRKSQNQINTASTPSYADIISGLPGYSAAAPAPSAPSGFGSGPKSPKSNLDKKMQPTVMETVQAAILPDRNFLVTQGAFIDCALETAISSDLPGFTSCRVTRDVYSTNGNVKLIDRGSRVVGQYQGGLQRGKARIFALWNRVETPSGVIVSLDSPGTDALGRSGHGGHIDTHFWERFGGAIMLSVIDDLGSYASAKAADGDTPITVGSTSGTAQEAAAIALENSINIPPTLYKNQGEHISIFVARDLDFSPVYDLAMYEE